MCVGSEVPVQKCPEGASNIASTNVLACAAPSSQELSPESCANIVNKAYTSILCSVDLFVWPLPKKYPPGGTFVLSRVVASMKAAARPQGMSACGCEHKVERARSPPKRHRRQRYPERKRGLASRKRHGCQAFLPCTPGESVRRRQDRFVAHTAKHCR